MGNIFSGSEIVELGINIEENGRDFYNNLAKQSKSKRAKEVFEFLAGEEERHIKVFQGLLAKTTAYEPAGLDADEYSAYMSTLAGEYIFTKKDQGGKIAKAIKSDGEAIDKGIGFEKDSVVFYQGIKKTVPDYDRKIIDELIFQEESHLLRLTELKKGL